MACNSCNSCNSYNSNGIWFPDFVSNSCCNPCCSGSVAGTSTGCGCSSCGCNSCNSCGSVSGNNSNWLAVEADLFISESRLVVEDKRNHIAG